MIGHPTRSPLDITRHAAKPPPPKMPEASNLRPDDPRPCMPDGLAASQPSMFVPARSQGWKLHFDARSPCENPGLPVAKVLSRHLVTSLQTVLTTVHASGKDAAQKHVGLLASAQFWHHRTLGMMLRPSSSPMPEVEGSSFTPW
ncbi:hypothetical protein JX265_003915 [Neoarthrinium moseri]|uniref:Uncharacterized protein n=1 Tax=Neoarthrinium moseri TaxID=1658444 RepID=A0A9P9WRD5_9PEZI|nr:uncharacterized protein JN550_009479 [Neoarthrinium moseri]KAI1863779.1 hypothetical protein JN550_009479 [Neoarthrinium moseri]KAI1876389.1 hypothetical protein JX265_003915 [Neoarthrinium moseri]